mgnify:FL=1
MDKIWSSWQLAVFMWVESPNPAVTALVVSALAGTGKTTTMVEAINRAPERRILATAFNRKNAEDLQARITNPRAEARTFNSLGYGLCKYHLGRDLRMDEGRGRRLAKQAAGTDCPAPVVTVIAKLASKGKHLLPRGSVAAMVDIGYEFDIVPDTKFIKTWSPHRCAELALHAMELARTERDGTIDYDDQVYLPVANGWVNPRFDLVIIDECQDTDPAQLELAVRLCKKGGRIIVVGDRNQAIYAFRGADSRSMDRLKDRLKAQELSLPVTYRCGKKIVELAAKLVPGYLAHESNPEGEIVDMSTEAMMVAAVPGDFVLSRKNAPLVGICLNLLKSGKRAKVEGRDIAEGLVKLVQNLGGQSDSVVAMLERLTDWENQEMARVVAASKDEEQAQKKAGDVADRAETVRVLSEGMATVTELVARIENLFEDKVGAGFITCMTVHKAKGREADTVYALKDTFRRLGQEEQNIEYVAITRAKSKLVWVQEAPAVA